MPNTDSAIPVDGGSYTCPITRLAMTVDGVILEGTTYWFGCTECNRIVMDGGVVLDVEKQWHPVVVSQEASL